MPLDSYVDCHQQASLLTLAVDVSLRDSLCCELMLNHIRSNIIRLECISMRAFSHTRQTSTVKLESAASGYEQCNVITNEVVNLGTPHVGYVKRFTVLCCLFLAVQVEL